MNEFGHLADSYREQHDPVDLVELSLWLAQVPCRPLQSGLDFPTLRSGRALLHRHRRILYDGQALRATR